MRRTIPFLLAALLTLSGCGRADEDAEQFLEIRTRALGVPCAMEAAVTADYGDRVYEFTLRLEESAPGEGVVTILAPETLAGVAASYGAGGAALRYDDLTLDTGGLTKTGLSPMDALPALLESWRAGAVTSAGREKLGETETLFVRCEAPENDEETVEHLLWLEAESGAPVQMEIMVGGYAAFRCAVESFEFLEKEGAEDGTGNHADVGGN